LPSMLRALTIRGDVLSKIGARGLDLDFGLELP